MFRHLNRNNDDRRQHVFGERRKARQRDRALRLLRQFAAGLRRHQTGSVRWKLLGDS